MKKLAFEIVGFIVILIWLLTNDFSDRSTYDMIMIAMITVVGIGYVWKYFFTKDDDK
jgi:hypothetical protein